MKKLLLLTGFLMFHCAMNAQDEQLKKSLKGHIEVLASDKFEGRETGTQGERLAYEYIISQFKKAGLKEKGAEGFLQAFTFRRATQAGENNSLKIGGKKFEPGSDFFPLAYSSNATVKGKVVRAGYGITAPALQYDDYSRLDANGKILLMQYGTPDSAGPHSKYAAYTDIRTRLDTAVSKGATAVIFINDQPVDDPEQQYRNRITPVSIPVIFMKKEAAKIFLQDVDHPAEITTELVHEEDTGYNVAGFIDNNAPNTVVIGAHYDHLGYGDDHSSLHRGEKQIHNGADDNASGVAALIELAVTLKKSGPKSNNYLFVAFSGEEKGLLGSNYFMKNPTIPVESMNYMINMDMLGRLKKEDPVLLINGTGTSPAWKITFDYINIPGLKIKTSESGIGPSDHTSFYLQNVPALHFFSGTHSEYHKPADDEHLINYDGEVMIINYILALVRRLDDKGKLEFTKTKDDANEDAPRFKVTLGVIPDYAFEGAGMRIDGVTEGKPAAKAGLKQGDVVIQLGDVKVTDMMSYMKALSLFSKGQTTVVKVLREKEEVTSEVTF